MSSVVGSALAAMMVRLTGAIRPVAGNFDFH